MEDCIIQWGLVLRLWSQKVLRSNFNSITTTLTWKSHFTFLNITILRILETNLKAFSM